MAHGQDRVDDSPLKMVLETLRRSQQNLSESVHGMSSEEQLHRAYMIHNLSTSLVGYQGSLEQLQSSEEVHALVSLLLSIGHSPEGDWCKWLFEEDVFSFVVPAFASMVLENGVVLVQNPTVIEAFQEIDSLSLSWVTKIKVSLNDAEQQHVLDRMGLTDSSINVQSEECEKSDKIVVEEIDGEVSTVKKVSSSFSHAVGEGRSVLVRFLLAGRESWVTDSGVVETGGKNGGEQRARSILSTSNEGSRENVSHLLARLRKLAFPSQEIIGFFGKFLLREGRDGFKSHSSPELDQLSDVLTSGPDLSLRYFNSHDSGQIAVDSRLIFVQKGKESMKTKCEEKLVKTKHAAGYSNSNTNVNIPAATQHALLGEPHDLRTILPPTDIQCRLPPAPPHPPYPNLWCWKRLLDSVANTHNYISNACQQVLEELDTECHETICHAIACVFRGQPAAILIQILHNNVSPRLFGIQDKHGNTPLHNAVIASNAMVVTELVTLYPLAIHTQNGELATPLDIAMSHKNNEVVDCLLRECVRSDPHSTRTIELLQTTLVKAMKIGYAHYLNILLQLHSEHGLAIDFECTDSDGHSAWHYLNQKEPALKDAAVKMLLASGFNQSLCSRLLRMVDVDLCVEHSTEAAVPDISSQLQKHSNGECERINQTDMEISAGGCLQLSSELSVSTNVVDLIVEFESELAAKNEVVAVPQLCDTPNPTQYSGVAMKKQPSPEPSSACEQISPACWPEDSVIQETEEKEKVESIENVNGPSSPLHPPTSAHTDGCDSHVGQPRTLSNPDALCEVEKDTSSYNVGNNICEPEFFKEENTSNDGISEEQASSGDTSLVLNDRLSVPYQECSRCTKRTVLQRPTSCAPPVYLSSYPLSEASLKNASTEESSKTGAPICQIISAAVGNCIMRMQESRNECIMVTVNFDFNPSVTVYIPGCQPLRYSINSCEFIAWPQVAPVVSAMLFHLILSLAKDIDWCQFSKSRKIIGNQVRNYICMPSNSATELKTDVHGLCSEVETETRIESQQETCTSPETCTSQQEKGSSQQETGTVGRPETELLTKNTAGKSKPELVYMIQAIMKVNNISVCELEQTPQTSLRSNETSDTSLSCSLHVNSAEESGERVLSENKFLANQQTPTDPVTSASDDLSSPQKHLVSEKTKQKRRHAEYRLSKYQWSSTSGSDSRGHSKRRPLRPQHSVRRHCISDSFSDRETSAPSTEEQFTDSAVGDSVTGDATAEERQHLPLWRTQKLKSRPFRRSKFKYIDIHFKRKTLKSYDLTRGKKRLSKGGASLPPSKPPTLKVLTHSQDKDKQFMDESETDCPTTPVHTPGYSPLNRATASSTTKSSATAATNNTEVDGFTTPPTETPPSISYGSARPSAAETTTTISPQCREEESSGLSVLEFTNSSNPLDVIHSHMKVYSKCCPRHDIRSVVIGTTYPPSDAFGPKRRYSSIKDIHSDPSHSQFDCTKKLSAQSSSNRHYRDSESQQIMFERPSPESVLRQNRGALPPKLHSPSLVQSLMETTESHPSPPLSSRQQTSQLHHPTENLAQGRSKNSEAAVVTVANREASAENPESTRRLENSIQSRQSTSFLDSQTVPRDHKERIRGTAELLHAQDYTRILPLAYEGDPPDSLPPLLKIPFVFITGLAYYKLSNHKKSVQFFTKCLALADDCGRDGDITICNIYIGDIDFAKRRYSEAAGRYQTALQHYSRESVAQDFRMVMPTRSAVWLKCGSAFKNASRVGDSVAAYEKAIEIAASKKDQLSAHTSLGNLYQGIGENGRAVKEYEAAIELAQDLEDNVSLGWNHGNLGNALLGLHQRDKALHHLFKALDMAVEFETTPQAIGRAYNNLGTAFQSLNELAKAEEHYDLALAQAIYGNDIPGQARVYGNIGNLQMLNKLYDRAVPHYTEVMRLSQDKATITTAHHNRGCAYYDWAEKKKTAAMPKGPTSGGRNSSAQEPRGPTRSSVPHAGRSSAPRSIATRGREVEIKGQQSSRHLTVSDSDSSSDDEPRTTESCFRVSLHGPDFERCEDIFRPHIVTPAIQKYYLQGTRDLEYVIKHHEENFSGIKGSSKGLSLSVSLFETNSRTFHRMQDCMVHIQKGEEQPIRYEDALLVAEQSRARTLGELMLRRRGPQLEHELMSPPSLFQMKAIVGRQSCPVVYLSYTGERLLGWLLYPTSDNQSSIVNMFEVPLSDNEFDGKSLDYHLRYSLNEQLVEKSFEMYKPFDYEKEKTEPLEKLYDLVARPVMRMLSTLDTKHSLQQGSAETFPVQHNRGKKKGGLRKIVVIPDSYTNLLPFTCVLNKDTGKFWGDDYYFQIMPSLLTMGILDQLPTVSVTIPVQYQQMLCVVGNPNIPRFKFNNEDWDLGKLPHATKEAEWVSHILQCKPILHEQATKDAVLMRIMNAKVIHLATHGSAVAGFLAFAGMTSSSSEAVDAKRVLIYPDEIESLNISPALVVLSSCDSGRGVFKADGIQGMARAFILAGAQAVLTALWRVPDESACIFMQFFYQYLVEGMRGTQALHKAILCLRCFSKYSQYIHWSGYQLTGREFQFSVSQSSSRAQLATRLGTSSVFPRLDILKNLETAFLNNPKLPTDVQVLHAPPGVKPSEPLVDFIHCHHTHFSGGIFWVNCRTPQLIEASLTAIKNCLRLKELSELPFLESHPTLVVLYYLDHFPKEDDSPLLSLLKHSSVHIVVVSKTAFPEQLQKSAHNQLIRGTNIINIKPLSTIHATQRLVHSALQNHHLTPSKTEQVLFEKLAEFTTGSPPIIDLTNSLLDLTLTRTDASASTEDALKDFASGVRLSELPQQKPLSVPREHLSSQPQEQFLRTPVRDVSRELYETIKKDGEEDVFITSAKYDSWQVVTVLIQHCDLTPEERLLLFCLSSFNCCPIPASYVTEIATIITKAAHQSHLASTLHNKLRDSKMLKVYPKPLIYHPNYPNSSTDEETDIDFVYIPRFISAAVWKDMMSDFDKVMALTTCYKALQISASQYQNLVGQSKQSTAENLQVLHLLGAASILVESFGQHFKLVGRLCFQQVYTIFVQLHRQPQPQVKSLDHL
jgi:tetratricopeptide (TPR) repeat protein